MRCTGILTAFCFAIIRGVSAYHYTYLGCINDNGETGIRIFSGNPTTSSTTMSPTTCRDWCMEYKLYTLFAIKMGRDCTCGHSSEIEYASSGDYAFNPESYCNWYCPTVTGAVKEKFGGDEASSVFSVCPLGFYCKKIVDSYDCNGECHCLYRQCVINTGECARYNNVVDNDQCQIGWAGWNCDRAETAPRFVGCYVNSVLSSGNDTDMEDAGSDDDKKGFEKCSKECAKREKTFTGMSTQSCYCSNTFGGYGEANATEHCAETCDAAGTTDKCGKGPEYVAVYTTCAPTHYGSECELTCRCARSECDIATGKCIDPKCQPGYSGDRCDMTDVCLETGCVNEGRCIQENNGTYKCFCHLGWTGRNCESPIDDADLPDLSDKQVESIFQYVESITLEPTVNPFEPSLIGCFVKADYSGDPEEFGKRTKMASCVQFCLKKQYTYAGYKSPDECRCAMSVQLKKLRPCDENFYQVYTVCTPGYYLYQMQYCESECHCKDGPCDIRTGKCPTNNCKQGYYGEKCNSKKYVLEAGNYSRPGGPDRITRARVLISGMLVLYTLFVVVVLPVVFVAFFVRSRRLKRLSEEQEDKEQARRAMNQQVETQAMIAGPQRD